MRSPENQTAKRVSQESCVWTITATQWFKRSQI